MISYIQKGRLKIAFALLITFFHCLSLHASHRPPKIYLPRYANYTFTASYNLHASFSSENLPVDLVFESNISGGTWVENIWIPSLEIIDLRFLLNNAEEKILVWHVPTKKTKYSITRLTSIHSSMWYPALKKLTHELGKQYFGKKSLKKNRLKSNLDSQSSCLYITPLKTAVLQTRNTLLGRLGPSSYKYAHMVTEVKLATNALGKKSLIVSTMLAEKPGQLNASEASILKFTYTKNTLKLLSETRVDHSSIWYRCIKKVVKKSVKQYFQLKKQHACVTRAIHFKQHLLAKTEP